MDGASGGAIFPWKFPSSFGSLRCDRDLFGVLYPEGVMDVINWCVIRVLHA